MASPYEVPVARYSEAAERWCLAQLYQDLALAKGKALTPTEKEYLRGLLSGYSPIEMADHRKVAPDTVRGYLSKGVYRYVEELLLAQSGKIIQIKRWNDVAKELERAGYRESQRTIKVSARAFTSVANVTTLPQNDESWDCQPDISVFYNRVEELALLKQWALIDCCRSIVLYGLGGIGKTSLAARLAQDIKEDFECLIWRSLRNSPPIQSLLTDILDFLGCSAPETCLNTPSDQISQLMSYLHEHRCLLILDDVQAVLGSGELAGHYQEGFESYGELLRRIEVESHKSCVVLTSWENPKTFSRLSGPEQPVRSHRIKGLGDESKAILADANLQDESLWNSLIKPYRGNPLALRMVASTIQDLFDGSVAEFIAQDTLFLGDFKHLLHQQFKRISDIEKEVMMCLANSKQPLDVTGLKAELSTELRSSELMEVLNSLGRRSLIEKAKYKEKTAFSLQPTVEKYIITR